MRKVYIFTLISLATIIIGLAWAEQITFSTYYPSPYGAYKGMKVDYLDFKNDKYSEGGIAPDIEKARIFYDKDEDVFKYSDGSSWLPLGVAPWTLEGDNLYTTDSSDPGTTWKVGIGTTEPVAGLTVNGAITRVASPTPNQLYGTYANTHINLASSGGVTGVDGQDYNDCLVLGGTDNTASHNYAVVVGGANNTASDEYAIVGGGSGNTASNNHAIVAGGKNNTAYGAYGVVLGGEGNKAGNYDIVLGGLQNITDSTAATYCNIIAGGRLNEIRNSISYSLAAGRRAKALHTGSFVWADSTDADYTSNGANTFNVRATGGVYVTTNGGSTPWDIAEEMFVLKEDDVQEAELVSFAGNDILAKTKKAYDDNLVGVVTSDRTTSLHLQMPPELTKENLEKRFVTLAGRAYVKVNKQNGPIKVGHPITSSPQAGIGMRASKPCKIIGYAMENTQFDQDDNSEILVFVNLGYYVPEGVFKELQQEIAQLELELTIENQDR